MSIGQLTRALAPTPAADDPPGQFVQTVSLLAPVTSANFPAEHPVHALVPTTALYDPAGQAMQFPQDPYVPTGQAGLTHTLEPAVDVLPASHSLQELNKFGIGE